MSSDLKTLVKEDLIVQKLTKINKSILSKINVDEIINELKRMLISRKYRSVDHTILENATHDVADWTGEIVSHRARLADIKFMVTDHKFKLDDMVKAVQQHITTEFSSKLKGQTVNAQKSAVASIIHRPMSTLGKLNRILALIEIVEKELENSYYSSVLIKNIVQLSQQRDTA